MTRAEVDAALTGQGATKHITAGGYTHYVVAPLFFTNGTKNGITFATRAPEGFGADDIAILRFVMRSRSYGPTRSRI